MAEDSGVNRLNVVGVGMSTLDVLIRLNDMPQWDTRAPIYGFRLEGGGPVATALAAVAKLGVPCGYVGVAGNDEAARVKLQSLRDVGVDLSQMQIADAPEDQVVIVYVHAETGERAFSGVNNLGRTQLDVAKLDKDYILQADILHLEGYHPEAALQAATWMKAAGKTVVLDGSKTTGRVRDTMRALVPYVDVLISGSGFAQGLTGKTDTWDALEAELGMGPRIAVQTEGENGAFTVTAEERFHTPAFNCKVVDTTGAGDVFHGAYIVGLIKGWTPRQCAQFATAVSALKCGKLGGRAGIPTWDETLSYLAAQGIDTEPYRE